MKWKKTGTLSSVLSFTVAVIIPILDVAASPFPPENVISLLVIFAVTDVESFSYLNVILAVE